MKTDIVYNKTILSSGLRVVSEKVPSTRSIAIGVWVDVGSRDEHKDENGITHFIEHMLFKGTKSRSTKEIAFALESLGGSLNAFTSRENTCYHAIILDEHLNQAIDILSDIIMNSSMSEANLAKEKQVVIEEIFEVEESPSEYIHELFSGCFWRNQPLGRPIMGSAKIIHSLDRRHLKSYMNRHYKSGRVVIAAAGNISHKKLTELVKRKFRFVPGADGRGEPAGIPESVAVKLFRNKSNQTHLCLGFPGLDFNHPGKNSLLALHAYLGGGMSSVLFQKIREEKGIAYTVYSFLDFYRDSGVAGVYLAADRRRLHSALEIIKRELEKVKTAKIPKMALEKVKTQMKGSLILGMESTVTRMNRLGRYELASGKHIPLTEALRAIDRITANDMIETARLIFNPDKITITSLGPADRSDLGKSFL